MRILETERGYWEINGEFKTLQRKVPWIEIQQAYDAYFVHCRIWDNMIAAQKISKGFTYIGYREETDDNDVLVQTAYWVEISKAKYVPRAINGHQN